MTKQSAKSTTKSGTSPNCQVRAVGVDHFGECPQQGPQPCSHAMPFGYCFLCTHPRVDEMIENTRKAGMVAGTAG
ncbi:MAG: hypothetical protein ACM3XO_29305 [Bacteroidota bacterium]